MNNFQLFLSLVCGVLPFDHLNNQASIVRSYLLMYIMPLIYFVCFGLAYFGPFGLQELNDCRSICRSFNTLFVILGFFLYLLVEIFTLLRRKQFFIDFKKSIDHIDECLLKCDEVSIKKKQVEKPKYKYYAIWFVVVALFGIAMGYDIHELMNFYHEFFFITLLPLNFPHLASSLVIGLFIHYVREIEKRFIKLNELLQRINIECCSKYNSVTVYDIETEGEKDFAPNQTLRHRRIAEHDEINEDGLSDADNISPHMYTPSCVTNLTQLFKIHEKLLSLSVSTNKQFGSQSVPFMMTCFLLSICNIYLQTQIFFKVGGRNALLDFLVFHCATWHMTTMMIALLLLTACHNVNSFSGESAVIVHKIIQKKPPFMMNNDLYYNKMKSFILQIMHWERYFQFNGIGLFALDHTLIFSMISSAFSYLIIMSQYDMKTALQKDGLV